MASDTVSEAQLHANQLNAQKSTGPRTEAGKNIARFNARRHGLTGQFYCMSEDDEAAYRAFEANLLADLRPVGHYESQIAISIIQDEWRLNRSRGIEFNAFGLGHDEFAESTHADSPSVHAAAVMATTSQDRDRYFANIALYETRIHRMVAKNEKRLHDLQAERNAAEATALREAELLVRLSLMNGEKADELARDAVLRDNMQANGFAFSISQILGIINRKDCLAEAEFFEKCHWDKSRRRLNIVVPQPAAA